MNDNNSCALVLSESTSRDAANQFHSSLPMRNGTQDEAIIAASTERRIRLMAFTRLAFLFFSVVRMRSVESAALESHQ